MTTVKRTLHLLRQWLALPFFALGAVFIGLWSIIAGKD